MIEAIVALYLSVHLAMAVFLFLLVVVDGDSLYDSDYHVTENVCGWLAVLLGAPILFCVVWSEEFK